MREAPSRITCCHVEASPDEVKPTDRSVIAIGYGPLASRAAFARAVWAKGGCAPLVLAGEALARARRHFLRRAAALGYRRSRDPMLRMLADGCPLRAELAGQLWQVALPPGAQAVLLASRTWVPAHMRPREHDTRVLGVAITRLVLDGREVALDSPALAEGWQPPEPGWRWTGGAGVVPVAGARMLAFELAMMGEYWAKPARARAAVRQSAAD
jgi:hypothetical protein